MLQSWRSPVRGVAYLLACQLTSPFNKKVGHYQVKRKIHGFLSNSNSMLLASNSFYLLLRASPNGSCTNSLDRLIIFQKEFKSNCTQNTSNKQGTETSQVQIPSSTHNKVRYVCKSSWSISKLFTIFQTFPTLMIMIDKNFCYLKPKIICNSTP